ncbi:MAG: SH3 domain-containing protein, partial [Planctomycetota bacterium]|nr:SH3 domain-containing protein [Planctomycetota bacterium]
ELDKGWAKIDVPKGVYVFISKKYVQAGKNGKGTVLGEQVNIRPEPNTRRAAMCQVKKNDTVRIIDTAGAFYKIEAPAETFAYISAKYIRYFGDLEKMVKDVVKKEEADTQVAAVIALDKEASEKGTTREELANLVGKYQSLMSDKKVGDELKTHIAQRLANLAELKQMFDLKEQNALLIEKLEDSSQQIEQLSLRAETLAQKADEHEAKIAELEYVPPPPPTYTGKGEIKSLIRLWSRPGSHKLVNDKGETLFILQSDSHDLEGFTGKTVGINGELQALRGWRTKLLHVDEIDVIDDLAKK